MQTAHNTPRPGHDNRQHLFDLLKNFSTAIVVTHTPDGGLHARPMAIAELQPDGDVYFATSQSSPKSTEVSENSDVMLTFQSGSAFAALSGRGRILRDRAEIDRLWSEAWKIWFPRGKDDPDLVLFAVDVHDAEYWDQSGLKGLSFMFKAAKAYVRGETPDADGSRNARVKL